MDTRALLREATAAAHAALEELPGLRALLEPAVSRGQYASVLAAFVVVHGEFEVAAARSAGWHCGLVPDRLEALRADLADLDYPLPGRGEHVPPPDWAGSLEALGACYVLEGSMLGGKLITRHLRQSLGDDIPIRYFSNSGLDTGRRWREFLLLLEQRTAAPEAQRQVLAGANDCYRWLRRVLA